MTVSDQEMARYLSGEALYGDDFTGQQLEQWFIDEEEAYANLGAKDQDSYTYLYHALNEFHGYRRTAGRRFARALGFGSAYGDELLPVLDRVDQITILEPSTSFVQKDLNGIPVEYVKPASSGVLPFPDNTFDLITCLDVLHHVPNVTFVISEISRCLTPGGFVIIREPVVSMGDWRKLRKRLTKHERGIPLDYLRECLHKAELKNTYEHLCMCRFVALSWPKRLLGNIYNTPHGVRLDSLCATLMKWNLRYHARTRFQKIRPGEVYFVAQKP